MHMVVTGCITAQTSQRSQKIDHGKVPNACGSARGHTVRGRFGAPHQQASLAHPPRPPSVPPSCIMHRVGGTNPQAALPATTWTPSHSPPPTRTHRNVGRNAAIGATTPDRTPAAPRSLSGGMHGCCFAAGEGVSSMVALRLTGVWQCAARGQWPWPARSRGPP